MRRKIIAAYFFKLARFYQDRVMSRQGTSSLKIRDYNEAVVILCYRWAISFDPNLSEAHYQLAVVLAKQRRWPEAVASFRQAIENNYPYLFGAYFNLGRVLLKLEKFEESIPVFHRALESKPNEFWSYIYLGDALFETGKISKAIQTYQTALCKKISKTHSHFKLQLQNAEQSSTPNFIIIGQAKCGTTSLYAYLTQHPQILPALYKEIFFWNIRHKFDRGLDWYLAHFPLICPEQNFITGEASTRYLDSIDAAQRLFQVFPKIKLIVLLRNPTDRALSEYYMRFRTRDEDRDLETAIFSELEALTQQRDVDLNNLYYLPPGIYIDNITKWMNIFPKNQFLILKSEDLFRDPVTTVNQVFQFLQVEQYQLKEYKIKNKGTYRPISKSMRSALSDYFRPLNQQLEEYLGMKFNWDSE